MKDTRDITDATSAALCKEVLHRGARLYRLEAGTLMVRHPDSLDTQFFLDEEDALTVLTNAGAPKRRGAS
jgi:hypothetical protein